MVFRLRVLGFRWTHEHQSFVSGTRWVPLHNACMRLAAHASSSSGFAGLGLDVSSVNVQSIISPLLYCKVFYPDPKYSAIGRNIPAVSSKQFPPHFPFDSEFLAIIPLILNPDWVQLSRLNLCS